MKILKGIFAIILISVTSIFFYSACKNSNTEIPNRCEFTIFTEDGICINVVINDVTFTTEKKIDMLEYHNYVQGKLNDYFLDLTSFDVQEDCEIYMCIKRFSDDYAISKGFRLKKIEYGSLEKK